MAGQVNINREFRVDLALGHFDLYSQDFFRGLNPGTLAEGISTQVWDSDFDWVPMEDFVEVFATSTDAADVGILIVIGGLGEFLEVIQKTVILDGQNPVSVGFMSHVQVAGNANDDVILGDVYLSLDGPRTLGVPDLEANVQSKIIQGNNVTNNGFFRVPRGFVYGIVSTFANSNNPNTFIEFSVKRPLDIDGPNPYALLPEIKANRLHIGASGSFNFEFVFPVVASKTFGTLAAISGPGSVQMSRARVVRKLIAGDESFHSVSVDVIVIPESEVRLSPIVES